jgi:uncharacterized membrane protein YjgN (DUF898 family)
VFFTLLLPYGILQSAAPFLFGETSIIALFIQLGFAFFMMVFWGYGLYTARRYRLSRTNWRGIRGTLAGSPTSFTFVYLGSLIAEVLSLGWSRPAMNTKLQSQLIGDMRFGDAAFKFKGTSSPLYRTFALCWFLNILVFALIGGAFVAVIFGTDIGSYFEAAFDAPNAGLFHIVFVLGIVTALLLYAFVTLPFIWVIYTAKEMRVFADYTRFDGAKFNLDISAWDLVKLTIGNMLILVFTFTIGMPYVFRRTARLFINRLSLAGHVDLDRIRQSGVPLDTQGEGLFDALDIGGLW